MNLRELTERVGVAPRQVRYMIAEKFVPPPTGGRAYAEYSDEHVTAIRRYMRLKQLGFTPASIRVLLQSRKGVPITITPQITLLIDPELFASGTPSEPLTQQIEERLRDALARDEDAEPPRDPGEKPDGS